MISLAQSLMILQSDKLITPLILSAKISILTLILHLCFGILLGYILTKKNSLFRSFVDLIVTIPMVFPPIATGFFLLMLLGRESFIGKLFSLEMIFSFSGILLASFLAGLPLVVKPIQSGIHAVSKRYTEAAYTLGKNELITFIHVILPNIKKSIIAGLTLSFARSLGEVGITMMLGGNIVGKTETISLAIYSAVFDGEFELAIVLSVLLATVSGTVFFVLRKMEVL